MRAVTGCDSVNDSHVTTWRSDPEGHTMKLSIRNQLAGEVVSVTLGAVNATVKVRLDGGDQIVTSSITKEAAGELGLAEGSRVFALVKASEVGIGVPD